MGIVDPSDVPIKNIHWALGIPIQNKSKQFWLLRIETLSLRMADEIPTG